MLNVLFKSLILCSLGSEVGVLVIFNNRICNFVRGKEYFGGDLYCGLCKNVCDRD